MLVDTVRQTEDSVVNIPDSIALYSEQLSVLNPSIKWKCVKNISISSVSIQLESPPQGSNIRLTIKRNGITFTKQIVEISSETSFVTLLPSDLSDNKAKLGDIYSFGLRQVGNTQPGRGINIQ